MLAVEQVPSLIDSDPERAMRLARSAGVLLVMSQARKQISNLRRLFANRGDDLAPLTYDVVEDDREGEWDQMLELGDMALDFDVPSLLDGLDAVGDFTSGGDSSSSDGGGD